MRIWTSGHGTRPIEDLLALLRGAGIVTLADVRTFPGSRRNPQYGADALRGALEDAGVAYVHLPDLGGRRRAAPGSPHTALRVDAFRAYADHMATPEFAADLARLEVLAARPLACLCAETLWWRYHRRMLSDLLTVRGWEVVHLLSSGKSELHRLWDLARVVDGRLVYDGGALGLPLWGLSL